MKSASLMSTWSMRLIRNINKTQGFYLDVIETEGPDAGSIRQICMTRADFFCTLQMYKWEFEDRAITAHINEEDSTDMPSLWRLYNNTGLYLFII